MSNKLLTLWTDSRPFLQPFLEQWQKLKENFIKYWKFGFR